MTKEQAIEDFFSNLKVAFNISALYKKEHPSFIKAAKEFQSKVNTALDFLDPIKIGVTPNSLMVDGNLFSGVARYEDLANMFHQRRIMSVEIKKGVSLEDLVIFLGKSSAPQREIFKEGGLASILARENVKCISVTELDYSQLLEGEGGECPDVWVYLLKDAVANGDGRKIGELADNFDNMTKHLKAEELVKNEGLRVNIDKFLEYLKHNDNSKFSKCLKGMVKLIIKDKSVIAGKDVEKFKSLFAKLNENEISSVLSEEILHNEDFDSLSFNLLCKLGENRDHEKIAVLTEKSLKNRNITDSFKIKKKIEGLFSLPEDPVVSEVYRSTLNGFLKGITFDEKRVLDRNSMKLDYRYILLNLLEMENDLEQAGLILERLLQVWEEAIQDNDLEYLKYFFNILNMKRGVNDLGAVFTEADKLISNYIENAMWDEHAPQGIGYFIDNLQASLEGADFYINIIFTKNKINYNVLKFFLKFFPDSLALFCGKLGEKFSDMDFIKDVIDAAGRIDSLPSIEILKRVYSFSNSLIKNDILKAMKMLSLQDNKFLSLILKEGDLFTRREALGILVRDIKSRPGIFEEFFLMPSHWGGKNRILIENIMIAQEMSLFDAKDYLKRLSKRRFFWNRNVRAEADKLLREWDDKKS